MPAENLTRRAIRFRADYMALVCRASTLSAKNWNWRSGATARRAAELYQGRAYRQVEKDRCCQSEDGNQGSLPARPLDLHRDRIQLRHAGAAAARTGIP